MNPERRSALRRLAGRAYHIIGMPIFRRLRADLGRQFPARPFKALRALGGFIAEYRRFCALPDPGRFQRTWRDWSPCLTDRTQATELEPVYFYQDAWGVEQVLKARPARHLDVGSSVKSMALLSRVLPVTFVDIRRPDLDLEGLTYVEASILALPFADGSQACVSSLCVVEHIGLGRYGDPLDPAGSEKALAELARVVRPGGDLILSVPVDAKDTLYFNAHRAFTRATFLGLLPGFALEEERYIYGRRMARSYDPALGFGTGLFHLRKEGPRP